MVGSNLRFSDEEESLFTLAGEYRDRKLAIFESTRTKEKAFQSSRYGTGWTSEESLFILAGEYRNRKLANFESTRTREKAFQPSRYSTG